MKEVKRIILIAYSIAMVAAALYVPWKIDWHTETYSTALNRGYSYVFSPPAPIATIDYGKVMLEFVVISALAAMLYVVIDWREAKLPPDGYKE
jgi:hypothetical protein